MFLSTLARGAAVVATVVAVLVGFRRQLESYTHELDQSLLASHARRLGRNISRPNFVLLTAEDMSSKVGCFGDTAAHTPHLDKLANEGVRFTNVHVTAPVCAPSRSSLWTGFHQNTLGTQNMRTTPPKMAKQLGETNGWLHDYEAVIPDNVRSFTETLRSHGYWICNAGWPVPKTDYQFGDLEDTLWDLTGPRASWRDRPSDDTPFFFYWNTLVTHESGLFKLELQDLSRKALLLATFDAIMLMLRWWVGDDQPTKPSDVRVPPYYPDTPIFRDQISRQYNNIAIMDKQVGEILSQLQQDGLWDDTIVIWTTDHGDGLPRGKRFCYDSGSKVPFIYKPAKSFEQPGADIKGSQSDDLVSFIDIAPTILHLAGLNEDAALLPGKIFLKSLGKADQAFWTNRDTLFCATDRFDKNTDMKSRSVRTKKWKLIHNLGQTTPYLTHLAYRDRLPCMREWLALKEEGKLALHNKTMWNNRPEWELYQLDADPDEINNLFANDLAVARQLQSLLQRHSESTFDLGVSMSELEMYNRMYPEGYQPRCHSPIIKQCPRDGKSFCIDSTEANVALLFRWQVPVRYLGLEIYSKALAWRLLPREGVKKVLHGPVCEKVRAKGKERIHVVLEAKATRYGYEDSSISDQIITCPP